MYFVRGLVVFAVLLWLLGIGSPPDIKAQIADVEEVSFRSGDVTLQGTVLTPEANGKRPAVVLVHGAGPGQRDENRAVAEALVNEGLVAFIYDKRTQGYSAAPIGERSYALLAQDAVAAVEMLQQRSDVNPDQVGLWGLSEGGWVAPLAATQSEDVSFVMTIAGGGVGPAEQSAWATEGALRRSGVTSEGALRALVARTYSFLVSAELFPEGRFDPTAVLEQIDQPILGLWGALDRIMPRGTSARAMMQALERGGNQHYVLRAISNADHAGYVVPGDQTSSPELASEYIETMSSWIRNVTDGNPPGPSVGELPMDEYPTRPSVTDPRGFARWEVQMGFFVSFHLAFGGYVLASVRRRNRSSHSSRTWRRARITALLGLAVPWLVYMLVGYVAATGGGGVAAVVMGRPVEWIVLQILAALLVLTGISLGSAWYRRRLRLDRFERIRLALPVIGMLLFVPWAYWWQLFSL